MFENIVFSDFCNISISHSSFFGKVIRHWKSSDEDGFSEKFLLETDEKKIVFISHCGPKVDGKFQSSYAELVEFDCLSDATNFYIEQTTI